MRTQALDKFCSWLEQTPLSQTIQSTSWVVPTVQTIHILAIAAVMSSVLMLDLRLLGVVGTDQPLARVTSRFRPVIWWPLPILLPTGAGMIIGEPARSLPKAGLLLSVVLLLAACGGTALFTGPTVNA